MTIDTGRHKACRYYICIAPIAFAPLVIPKSPKRHQPLALRTKMHNRKSKGRNITVTLPGPKITIIFLADIWLSKSFRIEQPLQICLMQDRALCIPVISGSNHHRIIRHINYCTTAKGSHQLCPAQLSDHTLPALDYTFLSRTNS